MNCCFYRLYCWGRIDHWVACLLSPLMRTWAPEWECVEERRIWKTDLTSEEAPFWLLGGGAKREGKESRGEGVHVRGSLRRGCRLAGRWSQDGHLDYQIPRVSSRHVVYSKWMLFFLRSTFKFAFQSIVRVLGMSVFFLVPQKIFWCKVNQKKGNK